MKLSTLQSIASLAIALVLTGCAGFQGANFPNVTSQNSLGTIQGSVFGGHAPIVGAHLFILEATPTGYGAKAKSLLSAASTATSGTYPVAQDTSGGATNGLYYVTTDIGGGFNVSGDYTCDIGYPVYIYASGGSSNANISLSITAISYTKSGSNYTYTFTVSGSSALAAGQTVAFPSGALAGEYATLNGKTFSISSATLPKFSIVTTTAIGTGANTQTGKVNWFGVNNPAVVNMALVGLCPGTKNFSTVPFIFMNEVSTAALAYGMSAFATDSLHIGSSSTNLIGLQNAALNAANLYDITGQDNTTTVGDGEGHIARSKTVAGNGVVPQATLDTVGNILAACVDSANATTTLATESANCNTLFTAATSNGIAAGKTGAGTVAIDTGTAAINIASNPGTAAVVSLYTLPRSAVVPFAPNLNSAPDDFSVAITYSATSSNPFRTPSAVAIDASGNAFVSSGAAGGYVTELSPQGAVMATSASVSGGLNSVAVDPNGNAWALEGSNPGALYEFAAGSLSTSGQFGTSQLKSPTSLSINTASEVYVADGGNNDVVAFNAGGNSFATYTQADFGCLKGVSQVVAPSYGGLFASSKTNNTTCYVYPNLPFVGNYQVFSSSTATGPSGLALDGNLQVWVGSPSQNHVDAFTFFGTENTYGSTAGGLSSPGWVAIDGNNNVWVANTGSAGQVAEYTNGGSTAVTGTNGYQHGALNAPSSIATDGSGDVWVTNSGANTVTEILGVAVPATPLSAQTPGTEP